MMYPKSKNIQGTQYIGTWEGKKVPIYDVLDINGLNQIIGYVKHLNASSGTVLYRGQCHLYPDLVPSIEHKMEDYDINLERLNGVLDKMAADSSFNKFLSWDPDIDGWKAYTCATYEAILQHYGAYTRSVDFVDNHWAALWFSLYRYDKERNTYTRRSISEELPKELHIDFDVYYKPLPSEPELETCEISEVERKKLEAVAVTSGKPIDEILGSTLKKKKAQALEKYKRRKESYDEQKHQRELSRNAFENRNNEPNAFLFLYLADTSGAEVQGLYLGKDVYTIDLRKALPSTFLRPVAQHGWIVKGKKDEFSFNSSVLCVLRIPVRLVDIMLGKGMLLSQENFFPDFKMDQGYSVLLKRQYGSKLFDKKLPQLLPPKMINEVEY